MKNATSPRSARDRGLAEETCTHSAGSSAEPVPAATDVRSRVSTCPTELVVLAAELVWSCVSGLAAEVVVAAAKDIRRGASLKLAAAVKILPAKDVLLGPSIGSGSVTQRHDGNDDGQSCDLLQHDSFSHDSGVVCRASHSLARCS